MKKKESIVVLYSKDRKDLSALALEEYFALAHKDMDLIAIPDDEFCVKWKSKLARKIYVFAMRNCSVLYTAWSKMQSKLFRVKGGDIKAAKTNADIVEKLMTEEADVKADEKTVAQASDAYQTAEAAEDIKTEGGEPKSVGQSLAIRPQQQQQTEKKPKVSKKTRRVRNIIRRFEPRIILCVEKKGLKLALKARKELANKCKIFAFNGDFAYEKLLLQNGVDEFFAINSSAKNTAVGKGVEESKISVVEGLPLPRECFKKYSAKEVKELLCISNDKPIITIVGGRYGRESIKKQFDVLLKFADTYNIVAVTGGSKGLANYYRMAAKAVNCADSVYILEKIDNFSKVLCVTDILVSAPTTAICYEAFYRKIPVVLSGFSGMVEKGNAQYMFAKNLALDGGEDEILENALRSIANDDKVKNAMLVAMEKAGSNAVVTMGDMLYNSVYKIIGEEA